jgi:hypothetical protein
MNATLFRLIALVLIWGAFVSASFMVIGNASLHWLEQSTMLAALAIFTTGSLGATFAVLRYRVA